MSPALKAAFKDPGESAFMVKSAAASVRASGKRRTAEGKGEHIPPFLTAGITSSCSLHCAGCCSFSNHATEDKVPSGQLTTEDWARLSAEADDPGISFILPAGGEPTLRKDVIEAAGKVRNILFPIFTNGMFLSRRCYDLFDDCRSLIPILSIEGEKDRTDMRRGEGVYDCLIETMNALHERGLIFGASVTATAENIHEVTSDAFLKQLSERGCRAVIFVEFVPVTEESAHPAPSEKERACLSREIDRLRRDHPEMVCISFPGDEKSSGGCAAAGRGFFRINSHGALNPVRSDRVMRRKRNGPRTSLCP